MRDRLKDCKIRQENLIEKVKSELGVTAERSTLSLSLRERDRWLSVVSEDQLAVQRIIRKMTSLALASSNSRKMEITAYLRASSIIAEP